MIYSRNYVKSESSVVTSNAGEDQSVKTIGSKPDGQMFMFMSRLDETENESSDSSETEVSWDEISNIGEFSPQKKILYTKDQKIRMKCFEMLRESMGSRYLVNIDPETMKIYIDGEEFQDFYERFNELKSVQKFVESCAEEVLNVAEIYVRKNFKNRGSKIFPNLVEELKENTIQPMAEHCAKKILAQQKGEKAPSPYNVLSKRGKVVAGYAGLKKGEYKYDCEIIAEDEQERYRELEEEAREKNAFQESMNRLGRIVDRLSEESDESYVTARSRFSRSVSRESRRPFTNNGVVEGPTSIRFASYECNLPALESEGANFNS